MTKEKKIEAIYKEMANKELTLGCYYCSEVTRQQEVYDWSIWPNYIGEIIWHPVMIGDALEVVDAIAANRDNARYERRLRDILMVWSKPRKPIDDQSDECIDYVYSLIQKD